MSYKKKIPSSKEIIDISYPSDRLNQDDGDKTELEFGISELGTKEYWDALYEREITNFTDNRDIGEVWFGESAVEKMVNWITTNSPSKSTKILDLGCGNGHLLLTLAFKNYTNLTGIDYSPFAITLAKSISKHHGYEHIIKYAVFDIFSPRMSSNMNDSENDLVKLLLHDENKTEIAYDIVLDKGTYDAISLNPDIVRQQKLGEKDLYPELVKTLVKEETGIFLITSCNWTEEELKSRFGDEFVYHSHIKHPRFAFGGATGQTISTVAFRPKSEKPKQILS
ncbi:hypothetical protein G9A89_016204 [Geosiphon pyriformis]|nr:hypothetical protein G9A89_016204 [Geosiphon pyriformis]